MSQTRILTAVLSAAAFAAGVSAQEPDDARGVMETGVRIYAGPPASTLSPNVVSEGDAITVYRDGGGLLGGLTADLDARPSPPQPSGALRTGPRLYVVTSSHVPADLDEDYGAAPEPVVIVRPSRYGRALDGRRAEDAERPRPD